MTSVDLLADDIADALAGPGYIVLQDALPVTLSEALADRIGAIEQAGRLQRAGIGRGEALHVNDAVRTDTILWLNHDDPAEAGYLDFMEQLRVGLNRRLFLGLFDYECHFAVYGPGAYYHKHLDAFRGRRNRIVTTVCYLNRHWTEQDGGELLIYPPDGGDHPIRRVLPEFGSLVIFLSDRFPHEVLAARRTRYSIAGWFRLNAATGSIG